MGPESDTEMKVDDAAMDTTTWRAAVPAELFERLRAKGLKFGSQTAQPTPQPPPAEATVASPIEAAAAPLPESYRAPFMPEPVPAREPMAKTLTWNAFEFAEDLLPEEPTPVGLPTAFQGLGPDWRDAAESKVLVSVRPVLDVALAAEVARRLDRAPGMSAVRSLGATGDIAAFEARYDGPIPGWEAVSQALRGLGASLVSTGDREFYLAIQGRVVN